MAVVDMIKRAKHFRLSTPQGKDFNSKSYQGKSNLLLVFYRGAWCNYCRKQITDLNRNYNNFKKLNIKIAAVSSDSQLNTSILTNLLKSKFPLLADPKAKVLNMFKIKIEKKVARPTVYLINNQGKVIFSFISSHYQERLTAKDILAQIKDVI